MLRDRDDLAAALKTLRRHKLVRKSGSGAGVKWRLTTEGRRLLLTADEHRALRMDETIGELLAGDYGKRMAATVEDALMRKLVPDGEGDSGG